ncbi:MAG: EVE domain-containing protein [Saprospiraceae bacterium]|nr:EVE domain-containing protein [Saprospiraceae bacterium]MCF8248460.1 EVE domain-containing protein [Saprospiraceae bacterium]MCF8281792.1 EVE domain-containing protein [Bacteroidales bacterium]MCF8310194.1 EVE domain-containing protein [Saprospiraceae bacterium]MCF8439367.1 EVE domain-containing protein [Saprospiraceae bacterium]
MNFWLIKSEPGEYSFDDLAKDGTTVWSGVRNYAARNNLRAMKMGELVLFYHSVDDREVVGVCKVSKEFYSDPTAESGDWSAVDVEPVLKLNSAVHLSQIKKTDELQNIALVRIGRLSVMPLEKSEFEKILLMGNTAI